MANTVDKYQQSLKDVPCIFALTLAVSVILSLKFRPPQRCQGHGVQFWQLHHSMRNVKIYECLHSPTNVCVCVCACLCEGSLSIVRYEMEGHIEWVVELCHNISNK